ncbi:glycosyltransferase family 87 protein [Staphylococcus chromogenes]|nr:glycosyltransferase family 87 protein [Staphylococcus chromogenes]
MPITSAAPGRQAVRLELPPKVLWIISAIGLMSGWWQLRTLMYKWQLHVDMEIYRAGARAFLANESLYAAPFSVADIKLPFIYPPFGALILTPFVYLSDDLAATSMIMLSGVLTFLCSLLVARALVPRGRHLEALAIACLVWPFSLLSEPITLNASFGQINVLIMALCVLDMVPRRRLLPVGTFIGIAAAIKLTPLVMCLYFLLRKDFRAILTAGCSLLLVTSATALYRFQDTKRFYTEMIFKMNSTKEAGVDTAYISNQSIKGMLARWARSQGEAVAHQSIIDAIWLILSLLTIAGCAYLMREMIQRALLVDAALVNAALMLLISPISWSHHWVWLPLFAMVLLYRWLTIPGHPMLLGISAGIVSLFCLQIKPMWYFGDLNSAAYSMGVWQKIVLSGYTWMAFAVLLSLHLVLRKQPLAVSDDQQESGRMS